ncbi:hypothetical protein PybrP1_001305 [[Pythium] brassicae (nom. inval.)]|nr:hypothetical protein PybrP1_001305 [[Pythium] brassicae (nom. inval.)]
MSISWLARSASSRCWRSFCRAIHSSSTHPPAVTDVKFQQSNMQSGMMRDRIAYYNAKHHLHGYKVEMPVFSNGLEINSTNHYTGGEKRHRNLPQKCGVPSLWVGEDDNGEGPGG